MNQTSPEKPTHITPMVAQYQEIKKDYPDTILFYRMGDFYEMFFDDAQVGSEVLGITLTSRGQHKSEDIPLAGFPHHALEGYLRKMLDAGHRVAVCEQVEDPKQARGVVKREVVEVFTRGTDLSNAALGSDRNNFIAALRQGQEQFGMAWMDVATGEFVTSELTREELLSRLDQIQPSEVVIDHTQAKAMSSLLRNQTSLLTRLEEWFFEPQYTRDLLKDHFRVNSLKGFGLEEKLDSVQVAGALLHYVKENLKRSPAQISGLRYYEMTRFLRIDPASRRNLELVKPLSGDQYDQTLFHVLDHTQTAMGRRLLYQRLQNPLLDREEIGHRLDMVEDALLQTAPRSALRSLLVRVIDLEHLVTRLLSSRVNARDLNSVATMLEMIPEIREHLFRFQHRRIRELGEHLDPLSHLSREIRTTLVDDPPAAVTEGRMIRDGFQSRLDELREIAFHGREYLDKLLNRERERTGIGNLKIRNNKVFGYYIEISKGNLDKVPDDYIRKQTLVNAERFITPELKEYEERILTAQEELFLLEQEVFHQLLERVQQEVTPLQHNSQLLAEADVILSLAQLAEKRRYVKPQFADTSRITISEGRHPVVEQLLPVSEQFIPNDVDLEAGRRQILLITGPNMAGKSTYLRMTALITIMAQSGSFVPANQASLGIVDQVFTRVGAADNLARGESTFLVEMNETANILNNATPSSLILLDEIGRGTSTYDGLSLAWAITEQLHDNPRLQALTMFATHYHELIALENNLPRLQNVNIQVREYGGELVFMRKIVEGGCSHSYGIDVARMAGVPQSVIERARVILRLLEQEEKERLETEPDAREPVPVYDSPQPQQLDLFADLDVTLSREIAQLDLNDMTPMQCMQYLELLQKRSRKARGQV